ncbi:hypothetical protein ABQ285_07100 [Lacticaseibacillus casei]
MNGFIWLIVITSVSQTMLLLDANVSPEPLEIKDNKFNNTCIGHAIMPYNTIEIR